MAAKTQWEDVNKEIDNAVSDDTAHDYIVLNSSTASSTKKFKVTVIDAGTLSATEIV